MSVNLENLQSAGIVASCPSRSLCGGCCGWTKTNRETVIEFIVGAISLLFITATAYAAGDVRSEIEAVNQKLGADFAKGDAAAISKLYTQRP